jgi:hypothetical protein
MVKLEFIILKYPTKLKNSIFIILLFLSNSIKAQIGISHTIGVMGNGLSIRATSTPLTFSSRNCIQVSNGVEKYMNTNIGSFINECVVAINYAKINIQVKPNPFTNFIYITFKSKIDNSNNFEVSIFNNVGGLVKIFNVNQNLFYTGYQIPLSDLNAGVYFLQISSSKVKEVIKIQKI